MRHFADCPRTKQPRVLGLSATLLNSNIKPEAVEQAITSLEVTFQSIIATVDHMTQVERFSTNPDEKEIVYSPELLTGTEVVERIEKILASTRGFLDTINLETPNKTSPNAPSNAILINSKKKKFSKLLIHFCNDLVLQLKTLGLFGGHKAALSHLVQLFRLRKCIDDINADHVILSLISDMTLIRKILHDAMKDTPPHLQSLEYSSPKVQHLFNILLQFKETIEDAEKPGNADTFMKSSQKKPCAIIFVERRLTAKVLYLILKTLATDCPQFDFIRPDFIVGSANNPLADNREALLERKLNSDVLKRFNSNDTNILVSTSVLEEGIDISQCNLVVKFDEPKEYRSYIQSKGRARCGNSIYAVMVNSTQYSTFRVRFATYQKTEKTLHRLLVGRTEERTEPAEEDIALELYDQELPPFCPTGPDGPKVTLTMAIPLIERYCTALPQDKFTILTPSWYLHREKTNAYLQLPISSPLRILVEGPEMTSRKQAKRAVALETCRLLYEMGELDKNLMPKTRVFEDSKSYKELFPLWEDESPVKVGEKTVYPGTKNMKRQYPHKPPVFLSECRPQEGQTAHLHVIQMKPVYQRPPPSNNRKMVFYDLLNSEKHGWALLSSKPLPKRLQALLRQSSAENWVLWSQVYRPRYLRCICRNGQLSHRYLPKSNIGKYVVDWTTVEKYPHLPSIKPPNDEQRLALTFDKKSLEQTVIIPWYRGKFAEQNYIVTRVCEDLSAQSSFPTEDYMSYADYFDKKYGLKVLRPNQPLIEVKAISNKLNCLRPRGIVSNSAGKRKRQELQEDFEEHLIPELCMQYTFPAELWLKATALPTILHRVTYLLMAEELRQTLSQQIGIGAVILPHGVDWKPLQEDKALKTELESPKAPSNVRHHFGDVFAKSRGTKRDDSFDKDQLPIDIDREMEEISLIDALTTSASNDIINLERVETLGDSFLKFAVSLFLFNTYGVMNEGVLTSLKGKILSNRNLTYSAKKIGLGGIIKVHDFAPISDWIPPGMCVQRSLQTFFQRAELSPHFLYDIEIPENERQEGIISGPTLANIIDKLLEKVELEERKKVPQSSMEGFLSLRTIADKCLADSVEALIGVCLKANGIAGALNMVKYLQVLPDTVTPNNLLYSRPCTALLGQGDMELYLKGTKVLEYKLGYTFKDRSYLLQALTHPSFYRNRVTDCYQRLEFLGDAILAVKELLFDTLILAGIALVLYWPDEDEEIGAPILTINIFVEASRLYFLCVGNSKLAQHSGGLLHCGLLSPGQITDLRSALVNNTTFAVLSVRYGFHQFILHSSSHLMDAVNRFVLMQEERCHEVNTDALYMLTETDPMLAEAIEVPKVLGDVFESIAGAIYLDSNKSLSTVWDIYYHLMKKEIGIEPETSGSVAKNSDHFTTETNPLLL
uniref:Dicer-2 n=1 Tax=Timema poppense TaxID=170557 RepID=A0A7R9GWZ1_TIMPO|nr:unnamed protein product [Timema poppensis]